MTDEWLERPDWMGPLKIVTDPNVPLHYFYGIFPENIFIDGKPLSDMRQETVPTVRDVNDKWGDCRVTTTNDNEPTWHRQAALDHPKTGGTVGTVLETIPDTWVWLGSTAKVGNTQYKLWKEETRVVSDSLGTRLVGTHWYVTAEKFGNLHVVMETKERDVATHTFSAFAGRLQP